MLPLLLTKASIFTKGYFFGILNKGDNPRKNSVMRPYSVLSMGYLKCFCVFHYETAPLHIYKLRYNISNIPYFLLYVYIWIKALDDSIRNKVYRQLTLQHHDFNILEVIDIFFLESVTSITSLNMLLKGE